MKTLVIGGNSGIGEEVVGQLRDYWGSPAPADLYVPSQGSYYPEELERSGGSSLDVTKPGDLFEYVRDLGPFREIVYSAGINRLCWIQDLNKAGNTDVWDTFEVNVFGFVNLVSSHLQAWPGVGFSAVAVVSDAARTPMRGSLAYGASKAALAFVVKQMARELAPSCRVNGVSPGVVHDTPMSNYIDETVPDFRGWTPEQARAYERSMNPMGRRVTKSEVAELVIQTLRGPEFMTGNITEITGGK